MADIVYDVNDSPVLQGFLSDRTSRIRGLMGPFGSGKSVACLMDLMIAAQEMPPMRDGVRRARYAVIRNTYRQLEDTTIATVHSWMPPAKWGTYLSQKHKYTIDGIKGIEVELLFRALDRPDHVSNLLSLELTGAWMNEAREQPRELIGPLWGRTGRFPPRAETGEYRRFLDMDTNPPDVDSWWYESFEDTKPDGWKLYRQPSGRSPNAENKRHLPADYYDDMVNSMTPEEVRVYVDAEYGYLSSGKAVYPEYRDEWHCREFEVGRWPVLRCWDFGLTPAAVFIQVAPNGQVRVFDEQCAERAGIMSFAPVVTAYTSTNYAWAKADKGLLRDVGDPAGDTPSQTDERTCFSIMHGLGIDIEPGKQDVVLRTESVRSLLKTAIDGEPGILIHPRCKLLRKGFQGEYQYRRMLVGGANARYALKPDKNKFSHPHDALQYGCVEIVGDQVQGMRTNPGEATQVASIADFDPFHGANDPPDVQHQQAFAQADFDPMR